MGKMEFDIFAAEGTYYEIGIQRARTIKEHMPNDIKYFIQSDESENIISARVAHKRMKAIERACPGLIKEIEGFASEIDIDPEKMVFYSYSYYETPKCCQMFVSPEHTERQCTYVGRSYEYYDVDERSLCITRVKGKPKHIGFSLHNAGRTEGMNEYGLVISMSSVMYKNILSGEGVAFWVVIRSVLENCRNVEEAIDYISETPIVANCNFMLSDAKGNGAVIEYTSFDMDKKKFVIRYPRFGLLVSTNHYVAESMRTYDLNHMWNSEVRYSSVWKELLINSGKINENVIKKIIAKKYPEGPCCHFYSSGMGTVRSLVFNATQKKVEVCFGASDQNSWTTFDFDYPAGIKVFQVPFEDEVPKQEEMFWRVYK